MTRHPPDLAIEILSPSTATNDRGRKMRLLARHGVREFWLVDVDAQAIEIRALTGDRYDLACQSRGDEPLASPLLPELALTAAGVTRV